MRFNPAQIVLSLEEWDQVLDDRAELVRLREEAAQHRAFQDEYLQWSLGGGMAEAVLAGMQLERDGRTEGSG